MKIAERILSLTEMVGSGQGQDIYKVVNYKALDSNYVSSLSSKLDYYPLGFVDAVLDILGKSPMWREHGR